MGSNFPSISDDFCKLAPLIWLQSQSFTHLSMSRHNIRLQRLQFLQLLRFTFLAIQIAIISKSSHAQEFPQWKHIDAVKEGEQKNATYLLFNTGSLHPSCCCST